MSSASHSVLALLAKIDATNLKPKTLDQARMALAEIHAAASEARTALAAVPPAPPASTATATSPTSSIPPRPGPYSTPEAHRVWNAAIVLKAQDLSAKCPTWAKLGRLGTDTAREAFFGSHREQLVAEGVGAAKPGSTRLGAFGAAMSAVQFLAVVDRETAKEPRTVADARAALGTINEALSQLNTAEREQWPSGFSSFYELSRRAIAIADPRQFSASAFSALRTISASRKTMCGAPAAT